MKKGERRSSIALIAVLRFSTVYLVFIGIAPAHGPDAIKIVIGGAIALGVIGYVVAQWRKFG